ncbi:hypothetical protein J6590_108741 [Homalodisca vitripennis]|nr:hypothetical protein J6590_108741 [Homalodisca vitripennis]
MLLTAYYAFFHPHLLYGVVLWGNSSAAKQVFLWQKKALRVVKGIPERESCYPVFKELHIMTLPCLFIYDCLLRVKANLSKYQLRQDVHSYPTRYNGKLDVLSVRLEKTKKSHIFIEIELFNKLPRIAWSVSMVKFKNVLRTWFKEKAFYSIEQYLASDTSDMRF